VGRLTRRPVGRLLLALLIINLLAGLVLLQGDRHDRKRTHR